MTYDSFASIQKRDPLKVNLMEKEAKDKLIKDVENPPFYDNIADI